MSNKSLWICVYETDEGPAYGGPYPCQAFAHWSAKAAGAPDPYTVQELMNPVEVEFGLCDPHVQSRFAPMTDEQFNKLEEKFLEASYRNKVNGEDLDDQQSTYRFLTFLASVQVTIGCDDAVVVPWCGMWLCIEANGYCHT